MHAFGLFVDVVVLVRRGKVGFVANVHERVDAGAVVSEVLLRCVGEEDVVESTLEFGGTAHEFDEGLHVVWDGEGVFEGGGFVGDCVPVASTTLCGIVVGEIEFAIAQSRREKAGEALVCVVVCPDRLPVRASVEILLYVLWCHSFGDLEQAEVVERIFDGPRNATRTAIERDVSELEPILQGTTTLLNTRALIDIRERVVWHDFRIFHHGLVALGPVDIGQILDVGIS